MISKIFVLLAVVVVSTTQDELDEIIKQVLDDPPKSNRTSGETYNKGTEDECTCVPYYLCPDGIGIADGANLLDVKMKDQRSEGISYYNVKCNDFIEVCCKDPNKKGQVNRPKRIVTSGCGQRHPNGVAFKIIGQNKEAQFGEFPWMIALLKKVAGDDDEVYLSYLCGGTLIHGSLVLTTAHCVTRDVADSLGFVARAGEWDTQRSNEIYPYQDRNVVRVIIHPGYNKRNLQNDFALLVIDTPYTMGEHIDTVCLPESGAIPVSTECYASGWGKDKFGKEGEYQMILKKVELPIVSRGRCNTLLRETRLGLFFQLHDSFICAGGNGKDTCTGDGGSPLVCPKAEKPDTYEVSGLVAWGIGCGGETPGVYANVAYARSWIDKTMEELRFVFHSLHENEQ